MKEEESFNLFLELGSIRSKTKHGDIGFYTIFWPVALAMAICNIICR
jgi:hypothetical protein